MPRPEHFGCPSSRELLALPRPEPAAFAEGYCQLARYLLLHDDGHAHCNIPTIDGPLGPMDYGYVLEDTGVIEERSYKVGRLSGRGDYLYLALVFPELQLKLPYANQCRAYASTRT